MEPDMRRPFVAGNWKMNGNRREAEQLLAGVLAGMSGVKKAEVAVCPPFVLIPRVAELLTGSVVAWGGQNLDVHDSGAYTGEVSGAMLKDCGCRYVIVGHSERRALYGETSVMVAEKFQAAQRHGLVPILCVGETLDERERGITEKVIEVQLSAVVDKCGVAALREAVVAYEPVWAIGTGRTATPQQAQDVHRFIRGRVAALDRGVADGLRIQYGGSVKPDNAQELFAQPDIDGGLIGGASLKAADFLGICRAAN
jgi:triosephosphate isomerase